MIKAVIIEDESRNVKTLSKILEKYCPDIILAGDANNIESAFILILRAQPELVFLDIELPGGNAFTLLDKLRPVNFQIIFVTAYDNYMLKAIKYSALDYLLKPLNIPELMGAVNKMKERQHNQQVDQRLEILLQNKNLPGRNYATIAIPQKKGFEIVTTSNIVRCEASLTYTIFTLADGNKIISVWNLKEYEDILSPDTFFRVHHSHIINVNYMKRFNKGKNASVEMSDEEIVPVAQRRKIDFLRYLNMEGHI